MNTQIIKQIAHELIERFLSELKYGLASPATFEQEYGEDECLKLVVGFEESGGGSAPDDKPYTLQVGNFDFYSLVGIEKWQWVNPVELGVSKNNFN